MEAAPGGGGSAQRARDTPDSEFLLLVDWCRWFRHRPADVEARGPLVLCTRPGMSVGVCVGVGVGGWVCACATLSFIATTA